MVKCTSCVSFFYREIKCDGITSLHGIHVVFQHWSYQLCAWHSFTYIIQPTFYRLTLQIPLNLSILCFSNIIFHWHVMMWYWEWLGFSYHLLGALEHSNNFKQCPHYPITPQECLLLLWEFVPFCKTLIFQTLKLNDIEPQKWAITNNTNEAFDAVIWSNEDKRF